MGCKVCTIACPFGTVNYNSDTGKVVKCDLCGGDPRCVPFCPTGAIVAPGVIDGQVDGHFVIGVAWAVFLGAQGQQA